MENITVRLGNAILECPECKKRRTSKEKKVLMCKDCDSPVRIDALSKYLYEVVLVLQKGDNAIIKASKSKLFMAEGIIGLLGRFGVREIKREVTKSYSQEKNAQIKEFEDIDIHIRAG